MGQLGFSLAQRQGDRCDDFLRLLLWAGLVSGWSTVSTGSHVGPPSYLRVSVVWMVPREMLVLLAPR